MSFQWQITPEKAWPPFVQAQADGFEADVVALAEAMAESITQAMKDDAPWTDRTGDARAALFAALIHEAHKMVGILLSHGSLIDYSVYLEYDHAGRFAILAPTVDRFAPRFVAGVEKIVRKWFR